jgi:predicted patatin/cPLA2 family phospholipase
MGLPSGGRIVLGEAGQTMKHTRSRGTALVVSGGGAKGAFAAGVVDDLFARYRKDGWFGIVGGVSTGALIAPLAALMGGPPRIARDARWALQTAYTTVSTKDILERHHLVEAIIRRDSFNESDPLYELVDQTLRPDWFEWLTTDEAPSIYVVYTNYQTGMKVVASPKDQYMGRERFLQCLMASASVPVIMEATIINGETCYDGGVRDLIPLEHAVALGAETIIPILLDPPEMATTTSRFGNQYEVLLRTIEILADEVGNGDCREADLLCRAGKARDRILKALAWNPLAMKRVRNVFAQPEFRPLFDHSLRAIISGVRPEESMTDKALTFDPVRMREWMEWGRRKSREVITSSPFR